MSQYPPPSYQPPPANKGLSFLGYTGGIALLLMIGAVLLPLAVVLFCCLGGAGLMMVPTPDPSGRPSASASATPSRVTVVPADREACRLLDEIQEGDRLMTADVLEIESAAGGTSPAIKAAAESLADAYYRATASEIAQDGDEALTRTRLLTAALEMETACLEATASPSPVAS